MSKDHSLLRHCIQTTDFESTRGRHRSVTQYSYGSFINAIMQCVLALWLIPMIQGNKLKVEFFWKKVRFWKSWKRLKKKFDIKCKTLLNSEVNYKSLSPLLAAVFSRQFSTLRYLLSDEAKKTVKFPWARSNEAYLGFSSLKRRSKRVKGVFMAENEQ